MIGLEMFSTTYHFAGPASAGARIEDVRQNLRTEAMDRAKQHSFAGRQHRNAQELPNGSQSAFVSTLHSTYKIISHLGN